MDIRSLTASQLHDLNAATHGEFMALLHANMISGPFTDADITVDFLGRGFRVDVVFGRRRDGHQGKLVTFVVEDASDLPEVARIGLLVLQLDCFMADMRVRRSRSDARLAKVLAERAARSGG
jgi:hypothetical protein